MAVQAQYPFEKAMFPTEYRPPKALRLNSGDLLLDGHPTAAQAQLVCLLGTRVPSAAPKLHPEALNGTTVCSGEPLSELTCNASGARKRTRDGVLQQPHRLLWMDNSRMNDSAMASTSGRPPVGDPAPAAAASPANSHLLQQLISQAYHQSPEVDALIRLQKEKLRSELEEMRKRHCRVLLVAMEQGVLLHLRRKEAELESANRRNAELEEKVRQMAAENEMWFHVAQNNDAMACSLRATLAQVFLQNGNRAGAIVPGEAAPPPQDLEEGYGDSDGVTPATPWVADDAQSCFRHGDPAPAAGGRKGKQGTCRVCMEGEASVVVLPCRHLCLCEQCEPRVAACPACKAAMNATLHVSFS